jgi:hypothetical protein
LLLPTIFLTYSDLITLTDTTVDETASESSSSPPRSSPFSSIDLGSLPSTVPRLTSGSVQANPNPIRTKPRSTKQAATPSFEIYEDTPADDRKREASQTAVTIEYAHDDKENRDPNANFEYEDYGEEVDDDQASLGQFVDTMFDELQADLPAEADYDDEAALFPLGTRMIRNRDRDFVLGTPSPRQNLDRTAMGDTNSSPSTTQGLRRNSPVGGYTLYR